MRSPPRFGVCRGAASVTTNPSRPRPVAVPALLVLGITGGLSWIAVPNFRAARERAHVGAAIADLKVIHGAVEMYNLDHNAKVEAVTPRLLAEMQRGGDLQQIPDMERTLANAPAEFRAQVGLRFDPAAHDGVLLPSEKGWIGGAPIPPPERETWSTPSSKTNGWTAPRPPATRLATFTHSAEDPVSTFAMDVDTASYTLARVLDDPEVAELAELIGRAAALGAAG